MHEKCVKGTVNATKRVYLSCLSFALKKSFAMQKDCRKVRKELNLHKSVSKSVKTAFPEKCQVEFYFEMSESSNCKTIFIIVVSKLSF